MTSANENNNNKDTNDESRKKREDEVLDQEKDSGLESDLLYAEEAIEHALDEHQKRSAERREVQLAESAAENEMFENMALEGEPIVEDGLPCLNCNTPLKGPYCYECGQPERHFIRFFPRVLWDMINEAFDLDSKIFRTVLPLMFKPGRLTMEYIAGRRAHYINPLRMYIVISLVFFLVLEFSDSITDMNVDASDRGVKSRVTLSDDASTVDKDSPQETEHITEQQQQLQARIEEVKQAKEEGAPIPDSVIEDLEAGLEKDTSESISETDDDDDDELSVTLDDGTEWHPTDNPVKFNNWFDDETTQALNDFLWQLKNKTKMVEEDPGGFAEEVINVLPALMFILLPIFALLLKIMYIFKKRYYMEHLIVALHSHSFIFFSLLMLFFVSALSDNFTDDSWIRETLDLIFVLLWIWIPLNLFIQQKRVYAQGKFMTTIKFMMILITTSVTK